MSNNKNMSIYSNLYSDIINKKGFFIRMSADCYWEELETNKTEINNDIYNEIGRQLFNNETDYLDCQTEICYLINGIDIVFNHYDLELSDAKAWDAIYCNSIKKAKLFTFEYVIIKMLGFDFYKNFINQFIKNHPETSDYIISINKRLNDIYRFIKI